MTQDQREPRAIPRVLLLAALGLLSASAGSGLLACAGDAPQSSPPLESDATARPQNRAYGAPVVRKIGRGGWVEVVAGVIASEQEAPAAARGRALAAARRAAVESVAGVRVRSGLLSYESMRSDGIRGADASSLVQSLTASRADALVIDEELLGSTMRSLPRGGYRVEVHVRARVLDRSEAADPGFRIEVDLPRERFLAGEEVVLSVRASRDARLYVLGITSSGAAMLLPNRYLRDTRTEAGEWLRFPDADLAKWGIRLVAQVPEGKRSSTEALVVVALRGDRTLDGLLPAAGKAFRESDASGAGQLLADLLTPLTELPSDTWTFDQVVYEVLAR